MGFDYYKVGLVLSVFWIVSNYILWAMDKTNFCILLFVIFLTSLCNSQDYRYDDYTYDEYDYNDQQPEDYTDDYSQQLNDYYNQNLLAPPNPRPPPILPPPTSLQPPLGKIIFFLLQIRWNIDYSH